MKKNIAIALLLLNTAVFGAAKETKMLPIFTEGYCATPTIALMGGYGKYADTNSGGGIYGLELGFACPVFQVKDLEINQVLSLVRYNKDGLEVNSLEMNPRIMFPISKKMKFGFGPGLGVVFGDKDTAFGFQLGASLDYAITSDMFIGLETRYQWMGEEELSTGVKTNLDNSRTLIKIGRHF